MIVGIRELPSPTWQPIETAPKDGTAFLGYLPADRFPAVCLWQAYEPADAAEIGADGYWAFGEDLIGDVEGHAEVTHWMPLPPPPEGSGQNLADAHSKNPPRHEHG